MHPSVEEVLREAAIPFRVWRHADLPVPIQSPADFAAALGYEPERITKTLLLKASGQERFCVVVIPANARLNFASVSEEMCSGRYSMASPEHLSRILGYQQFGVSPLGVRDIPVVIERHLQTYETILIGSGLAGIEIELAPSDLAALTRGILRDIR